MTARSRERGSHAGRPRGHVPFPPLGLGTQTPVRPVGGDGVADPVLPRLPDAPEAPGGPVPPGGPSVQRPSPNTAPPKSRPPRSGGSRHRKQTARKTWLSRKQKMAAVLVLVVAALGFGFADGFGSEASPEPAVQAFLLDWQQGRYAQAAALTDGGAGRVTAELAAAYTDVDATDAFFALKSITQHGSTAVAEFQATVDLAQSGQQWTYTGRFLVTSVRRPVDHSLDALAHQPQPRGGRPAGGGDHLPAARPDHRHERPAARDRVGRLPDRRVPGQAHRRGGDRRQVQRRHRPRRAAGARPDSGRPAGLIPVAAHPSGGLAVGLVRRAVAEAGQGAGPRLRAADGAAVRFGRAADGRRGRDGELAGAARRGRRLPARHDRGTVRP